MVCAPRMSLLSSGGSSGSGKGGVSRVVTLCERFVTLLYTATYQEPLDYSKYCSSSFVDSLHTTFSAQFLARAHVPVLCPARPSSLTEVEPLMWPSIPPRG